MTRRPRQSFGGNQGTGIFWRKRFCNDDVAKELDNDDDCEGSNQSLDGDLPSDDDGDVPSVSSPPPAKDEETDGEEPSSQGSSQEQKVLIGWDDDLCRPIYIRPEGESQTSFVVVAGEFDEEVDDAQDSGDISSLSSDNKEGGVTVHSAPDEAIAVPFVMPEVIQNAKARGRKRNKTFGDRNTIRRPLSLILSEHGEEEDDDKEDPTVENHKRQRKTVYSTMDSLATLAPAASSPNGKGNTRRVSSSPLVKEASDEGNVFAFPLEDSTSSKKTETNTMSPLKRAREFFADLDKTQKLTVDSSYSPAVSGKVVRTSRHVDFSSPNINGAYQAYVVATESSGVTPLSIKDFVKSRKLQLKTKGGDLFDGFLDDC